MYIPTIIEILADWKDRYPNRWPTVSELAIWKSEIITDTNKHLDSAKELDLQIYEALNQLRQQRDNV
jgi:hypothetical protein